MPTGYVLANKLNLRAQPIEGAVLAVLERGQLLDVSAPVPGVPPPTPGWLSVTAELNMNTIGGFVAEQFVSEVGKAPSTDATADGTLRVTTEKLRRLTPTGRADILQTLANEFDLAAPSYELTTTLRVCHFLAQAAHESMGFSRLKELGGPTWFARYEGRKDLGNVNPGDGVKYYGRGIFQLTGRANYADMGPRVNVDLIANPDAAMQPSLSLRIASIFWTRRKLNTFADADDIREITRRINGGANGLAERTHLYEKARTIWG